MLIGILGALDDEIKFITANMTVSSQEKHLRRTFFRGTLGKHEVVVACSGMGKRKAAECSQFLIEHFNVNQLIFAGVAGSLNPELSIGDIVISTFALEWDILDKTISPAQHKADRALLNSAVAAAQKLGLRVYAGTVLTGDQPVFRASHKQNLRQIHGGDCVDMESGAAARVCVLNGIPFVIIRVISDMADETALKDIFKHFNKVVQSPAQVITEMLKA